MEPAPSRAFVPYLVVVHVLGLLSFVVALLGPALGPERQSAVPVLTYAFLAVAVVIGELRPIVVPRGDSTPDEITVSTTLALDAGVQVLRVSFEGAADRDLGDDRETWTAWWTDQRGYAYRSPEERPKPTFAQVLGKPEED